MCINVTSYEALSLVVTSLDTLLKETQTSNQWEMTNSGKKHRYEGLESESIPTIRCSCSSARRYLRLATFASSQYRSPPIILGTSYYFKTKRLVLTYISPSKFYQLWAQYSILHQCFSGQISCLRLVHFEFSFSYAIIESASALVNLPGPSDHTLGVLQLFHLQSWDQPGLD